MWHTHKHIHPNKHTGMGQLGAADWALDNWLPGQLVAGTTGCRDNWLPGQLVAGTTGRRDGWAPGQLGAGTAGRRDNWLPGQLGAGTTGRRDSWALGKIEGWRVNFCAIFSCSLGLNFFHLI